MLFRDLKLKNKILFTFLVVFFLVFSVISPIAYFQIKKVLKTNIEDQLSNMTQTVSGFIESSALVSIKNRLRSIAEKNLDLTQYYYSKHRSGLLTRDEAFEVLEEIFTHQPIGISGYIYCLDSSGMVLMHPNDQIRNRDMSQNPVGKKILEMKDGYFEYVWKNPGEQQERLKSVYMVYYKPMDLIICASAYKDEFHHLVDIADFKESVLLYKTGGTRHTFVLDETGILLVHRDLEGANLLAHAKFTEDFISQIHQKKKGRIEFEYKYPGETKYRQQLAFFRYLPPYKWIVVSADEVKAAYSPLAKFRLLLVAALIAIFMISIAITYLIVLFAAKPLETFIAQLEKGATGDVSIRIDVTSRDEFGQLAGHFNSFMDQIEKNTTRIHREIEKNRAAKAELEIKEMKLAGIFNQSFQYTAILSPQGILEEMNQSGIMLGGESVEVHMSRPFWQIPWFRHDREVQQLVETSVQKAGSGVTSRFETSGVATDGTIIDMDLSIKPILDQSGSVFLIFAEARDITSFKKTAQEKKKMAIQLEKAQKMEAIGTLAGGIAHDFNNILSSIMGHTQLAEIYIDTPEKIKNNIVQINAGAMRAAELVQQILTFSRQTDHEKQHLSLYHIVKETLKLLRSSLPATIEINENIVSRAKISADPTRMHQVVMNLCTNAYHAMNTSGGILSIQLIEVDSFGQKDILGSEIPDKKYLQLEVKDTGTGIDEAMLMKIFDPYFTTKEVGKGTGLGLSIVYAVVEEHNGYIRVESEPGKGTSFYILLPYSAQHQQIPSDKEESPSDTSGSETIMYVDDEENLLIIAKEYLTNCGYQVQVFEDAVKAFEAFKSSQETYDLIITDMTMPKMTGVDFAKKVLDSAPDMPIILCTGYSETISKEKALGVGIRKYVQKPVAFEDMLHMVRDIFDHG